MMRSANDAHVSKVTHHPHPTEITQPLITTVAPPLCSFGSPKHGHTHAAAVSTHARPLTGIRMLLRCCFSLLCPPTGHDPRHLFVSAPTVRSLGNGPHLMTSGMPRAVVAVSSVIPLLFGLMSRNYNPREILTCSQLTGLACN